MIVRWEKKTLFIIPLNRGCTRRIRGDRDARTFLCNRLVAELPRTDASVGYLIMPDLYCSIAVIFRNLQLRAESYLCDSGASERRF